MKWCQTCKTEYEDFATKCSDCGGILVSEIIYANQSKDEVIETNDEAIQLVEVYTSTLESDILMVSEFLQENGIVCEIRNEGIGSYLQIYGGVNYLGTSVCVDEEDAENAKALIDAFWKDSVAERAFDESVEDTIDETIAVNAETDELSSDGENYKAVYEKKMTFRRNLLKLFIVFILGSGLFFQVLSFLTQ